MSKRDARTIQLIPNRGAGWFQEWGLWGFSEAALDKFVAAIRADEREACARLCEDVIGHTPKGIAAIIRARGE